MPLIPEVINGELERKGSHCIISSLWEVRLTSKKGDATWNSHVMHMLLQEETFEF